MNNYHKLGVMNSYINFQLLDHLKECHENNNESAREIISSFAAHKKFSEADILNRISNKETTLVLLAGMIFFVRSTQIAPPEEDRYKWWNKLSDTQGINENTDVRPWAITIIRNAIAHWGESNSGVEFLDCSTKFTSIRGSLKLTDEGLHELVMQLYGYSQQG